MAKPDRVDSDFIYALDCGTAQTNNAPAKAAVLLIGGAEEGRSGEHEATEWFLKQSGGGNFLVLRFGKPGNQANWICDNYRDLISSAAELAINSRGAANHPDVIHIIRHADALFLAGGDQNQYQDYWEGTAVEEAVNYLIREKHIPIAGTSAGMAILGDYYYAPAKNGVLSSEILDNPFHPNTQDICRSDFVQVPILQHVITDTHLDRVNQANPEPRYGRIFGFLARVLHDTKDQLPVRGIGVEEGAFVAINHEGVAKVFGNGTKAGQDAYFLQATGDPPEQIAAYKPLVWNQNGQAVKVYRISGTPKGSGRFDMKDWSTAAGGRWEYWFTTGGTAGFQRQSV
jgi:cyanophycinase-like exopeptidase